jgi:hypothetical protein
MDAAFVSLVDLVYFCEKVVDCSKKVEVFPTATPQRSSIEESLIKIYSTPLK